MIKRVRFQVKGIVQGVGFRPFVYHLAQANKLNGWVFNNVDGLEIEIEGSLQAIRSFRDRLRSAPPPRSHIESITESSLPPLGHDDGFIIRPSRGVGNEAVLISPDISTCPDCLAELAEPTDHHYHYPFINCTNCGPRFTIVLDVPYDRQLTTMKSFTMCPKCREEYDDPQNRRFHAQPNACPVCGPRYWLEPGSAETDSYQTIERAKQLLLAGDVIAIKGLGGFHLCADARDKEAVNKLRQGKNRGDKPFAVMVRDLDMAREFCLVSEEEAQILSGVIRPIVLLKSLNNKYLAERVAPGQLYHGVMLPYTPFHHLLLEDYPGPLVMTSGNLSDEPIAYENETAREDMSNLTDYFLLHNRSIRIPCDDSVVRIFQKRPQVLRRSRGYVPAPLAVKNLRAGILAVGAEEKNTLCLTKDERAFLSHHLTDLKHLSAFLAFKDAIEHFEKLLGVKPKIVAYDPHPEYLSTRYAVGLPGVKKIAVQHHCAHIAGCMAEHNLNEPVIGLAMDGTGYGEDGVIWGGEILVVDRKDYARVGHLTPLPAPGGNLAVREPWRMALCYLYRSFGEKLWDLPLPFLENIDRSNWPILKKMIDRQLNSPLTTSMGRFFDAVSALLGICAANSYSGQAAIELEMAVGGIDIDNSPFDYRINKINNILVIDQLVVFREVVGAYLDKTPVSVISARFHNTLAKMFGDIASSLREIHGINKVCLAGGVFQNLLLLTLTEKALRRRKFQVYWSEKTPVNDGGVSLGQAWIASNLME